jgi:hypothetical protein
VTANMIGTNIGITFLSVIDGDAIAEGARVQAIFRAEANAESAGFVEARTDRRAVWDADPADLVKRAVCSAR